MPAMRIRAPFAAAFTALMLISAYLGLTTSKIPQYGQSDKGLHFVVFFLLTITFYWILEIPRRRVVHLTLLVCTVSLSIGSEVVQALLNNGREFDPYDILANVVGSSLALGICQWYHKRMLERRRQNKHYDIVPGEALEDVDDGDLELGEGPGYNGQETGSVPIDSSAGQGSAQATKATDVTEELDRWDENEEDWEENETRDDEVDAEVEADGNTEEDTKKRAD